MSSTNTPSANAEPELLDAFRARSHLLSTKIQHAILESSGDCIVFERLGDELDEYRVKVVAHEAVFPTEEKQTLMSNLNILSNDIRTAYTQARDSSHHGHPQVVLRVRTGKRGRPHVAIEPQWLRWAYSHKGVSAIARFLKVSRGVVRKALVDSGIAAPCGNPDPRPGAPTDSNSNTSPAQNQESSPGDEMPLPDPPVHPPPAEPSTPEGQHEFHQTWTRPTSTWSDDELDAVILCLRTQFPSAGLKMLAGLLDRLGAHVPRERIRASLFRVDPVRRVFQRTPTQRRKYKVAGPNALWHHDGQHGLICWGIIIHGFIDGYSRVITGLRASDNNRASTVLQLFFNASQQYGVPSRVRGDHGVENLLVAEWMEQAKGERRGSYIWGRSVHNIRIERLWVDVTAQWGAKWAEFFTVLEAYRGLNVNNHAHLWLLHHLFLDDINWDASFWADGWNRHKMSFRGEASQSPAEMWGFDMVRLGVRGDKLELGELEMYGVDWKAIGDETLRRSQEENNPDDDSASSWVGRQGPPPTLNEVTVDPPPCPVTSGFLGALQETIAGCAGAVDRTSLAQRWTLALAFCQDIFPHAF